MHVRVECYAGYKGAERPQRFYLAETAYEVRDVLDQWYGPDDTYFKVRADDGQSYILRHTRSDDENGIWTLEAFWVRG